jgi:Mg2+-importing ATPase
MAVASEKSAFGILRPVGRAPELCEPEAADIWKATSASLLQRLNATPDGLSISDARSRLAIFGFNNAATAKQLPLWLQFLGRFRNPLVIILLIASALSAATGDLASFLIVVSIVTISITLDFVQEVRAQNAVEALRRSVAVQAKVLRGGASRCRLTN